MILAQSQPCTLVIRVRSRPFDHTSLADKAVPTIVTLDAHKHLGTDKGVSSVVGTPGTLSHLRGHVKVGAQPVSDQRHSNCRCGNHPRVGVTCRYMPLHAVTCRSASIGPVSVPRVSRGCCIDHDVAMRVRALNEGGPPWRSLLAPFVAVACGHRSLSDAHTLPSLLARVSTTVARESLPPCLLGCPTPAHLPLHAVTCRYMPLRFNSQSGSLA